MLDAGQEKIIDDVEPLVQNITTWQEPTPVGFAKSILIRFQMNGRHSENYYPGAHLDGKQPPMPAYRIKDPEGKLLSSGQVSGVPPEYHFRWKVPAGFTGKFYVEADPLMGPFQLVKRGGAGDVK
jgi:hypothetical protein